MLVAWSAAAHPLHSGSAIIGDGSCAKRLLACRSHGKNGLNHKRTSETRPLAAFKRLGVVVHGSAADAREKTLRSYAWKKQGWTGKGAVGRGASTMDCRVESGRPARQIETGAYKGNPKLQAAEAASRRPGEKQRCRDGEGEQGRSRMSPAWCFVVVSSQHAQGKVRCLATHQPSARRHRACGRVTGLLVMRGMMQASPPQEAVALPNTFAFSTALLSLLRLCGQPGLAMESYLPSPPSAQHARRIRCFRHINPVPPIPQPSAIEHGPIPPQHAHHANILNRPYQPSRAV